MSNISVAIIWHFHQPIYTRPEDNVLPLPWVRLHAIKDYLDMLRHVQNFPDIHVTFNFTPSLLLQIKDYKDGRCTDRQFLLFKKRTEELTVEERIEVLRDFFLANWERMVEPYPRYFSLLLKRGKNIVEQELPSIAQDFTVDELRDLQIWANLAWIDPVFRIDIEEFYKQGKNFREQDKEKIIAFQKKIIDCIFDEYKKALEAGQIELTTSPLHHPILPLLVNSNLAKPSNPNLSIPFEFSHPEDATTQIAEGIKVFEEIFGQKPKGLWPSEGGVCQALIPILSSLGIEWIATDEEILARSIKISFRRDENGVPNHPELLYKPWRLDNVKVLFRDHILSDLIAFVYYSWNQKEAAKDLVKRIKQIGNSLPSSDKFIIPIVLDGENAWEYFENDGNEFLNFFYEYLIKEHIPTTTISKFLHETEVKNTLSTLFPGSWIGANFNIWIGQPQDHQAWQIVKNLRDKLIAKNITDKELWNRFYILEGSDWFWWFGDEHFSLSTEIFDELFRLNATWIYKKIGEEAPPELFSPINKKTEAFSHQPIDEITPVIDGRITYFYEWYNAGYADIKRIGGTMQRFAGLFSIIYCGFDKKNLYIRFDIVNHDIHTYQYSINFYKPMNLKIELGKSENIIYKIDEICEIAIPFSLFAVEHDWVVEFNISAHDRGTEIDRTPLLRFHIHLKHASLYNWTV